MSDKNEKPGQPKTPQSANVAVAKVTREVQTAGILPSGIAVTVYKGKGRDVLRASRMVDTQKDGSMAMVLALAAVKCEFDGVRKTYEDLLEMSDLDAFHLIGLAMGKDMAAKLLSSSADETLPN